MTEVDVGCFTTEDNAIKSARRAVMLMREKGLAGRRTADGSRYSIADVA